MLFDSLRSISDGGPVTQHRSCYCEVYMLVCRQRWAPRRPRDRLHRFLPDDKLDLNLTYMRASS